MGQGFRGRSVLAIAVVAVVLVVALLAQNRGTGQPDGDQSPSVTPSQLSSSTSPSVDTSAKAEAFMRDELPRRADGDPLARGAVNAPVVLTEWADYRCPYCSLWVEQVLPKLQPYVDDGSLRIEFRDLALFGEESVRAATAARAAGLQGKYFEFQQALFGALPNTGHPDVPDDLVYSLVDRLGLDRKRFATDWADSSLKKAVAADTAEAQQLGINSTPSFVVGGQYFEGYADADVFIGMIKGQLAQR